MLVLTLASLKQSLIRADEMFYKPITMEENGLQKCEHRGIVTSDREKHYNTTKIYFKTLKGKGMSL